MFLFWRYICEGDPLAVRRLIRLKLMRVKSVQGARVERNFLSGPPSTGQRRFRCQRQPGVERRSACRRETMPD